jgi:hypothetical protein
MFANDIIFRPLIIEETPISNIYTESLDRVYGEPIYLTGKEEMTASDPITAAEKDRITAKFTFPYKTFLDNDIDVSLENLPVINRGRLEYLDKGYSIKTITPRTFITGIFLFYTFDCEQEVDYNA